MSSSSLCVGQILPDTKPVPDISSNDPLEKTDFFSFASQYELQKASLLEVGPCVYFPLSVQGLTPSGLKLYRFCMLPQLL